MKIKELTDKLKSNISVFTNDIVCDSEPEIQHWRGRNKFDDSVKDYVDNIRRGIEQMQKDCLIIETNDEIDDKSKKIVHYSHCVCLKDKNRAILSLCKDLHNKIDVFAERINKLYEDKNT